MRFFILAAAATAVSLNQAAEPFTPEDIDMLELEDTEKSYNPVATALMNGAGNVISSGASAVASGAKKLWNWATGLEISDNDLLQMIERGDSLHDDLVQEAQRRGIMQETDLLEEGRAHRRRH